MRKISAKEATRLARNYPLSVRWSDEDQVFVGSIPGLVGECCHGATPEEVIPQLKNIGEDLVSYLTGKDELLPAPPIHSSNPDQSRIFQLLITKRICFHLVKCSRIDWRKRMSRKH